MRSALANIFLIACIAAAFVLAFAIRVEAGPDAGVTTYADALNQLAAQPGAPSWFSAHWTTLAWALVVWVVFATSTNTVWPRPEAPKWAMVVHVVLIDWPAALPSAGMKGIFGLPVAVPFLSVSKARPTPPPLPPAALVLALLSVAFALPGCCSQLSRAQAEHARSDKNRAIGTLDATKKLRDPACNAVCRDANLRFIEAQAEQVAGQ